MSPFYECDCRLSSYKLAITFIDKYIWLVMNMRLLISFSAVIITSILIEFPSLIATLHANFRFDYS